MAELEIFLVRVTQIALALTALGAVYSAGWLEWNYRKDLPARTGWSQP